MGLQKYRREAYLTAMMTIALSVIIGSAWGLDGLPGLVTTAAGVFVAVLGVGGYDSWYDKANVSKIRSKR